MADLNRLIVEKLDQYPSDVRDLAVRAVELSTSNPEQAVTEMLKGLSRDLVRKKGQTA